jgi:hypothetical protein
MEFTSRIRGLGRADHALVVFSDIEMGAGGDTDDFPASDWLAELFGSYNDGPWSSIPLTLVFDGDTFDLLKCPVDGTYTHLVDEVAALAKMRAVIEAHPWFFHGLHRFLRHPGAERDVVFVVGNHDFELLFPGVQAVVRDAIGGTTDNVRFPGFAYDVGDVHVEHGSQADPLFRMDPAKPFVQWAGRPILNLPWGAVALAEVAMPLHSLLYPCDRARPLSRVLEMLPEVRALLLDRYWQYWTRDWLSAWWFAKDPTKRVSWTLFRQVAWRLQSGDASIALDPALWDTVNDAHRVVISGHLHDPTWSTVDGRRVLHTGCLRDEFHLEADGTVGDLLPKVYAEVLLAEGRAIRAQLVEVLGDRERAARMPGAITEVLEGVRQLRADVQAEEEAQAAQLAKERAER